MSDLNPRLFVTCKSAFDAGYLFGVWLDATKPLESIQDKITSLLAKSPFPNAKDYLISDAMDFSHIQIKQFELEEVLEIAAFIHEHGQLGAAIIEYNQCNAEDAQAILEDSYRGAYESKKEFATQLFDDCYTAPEPFDRYIDYDKFASNLFYSGDYYSIELEGDYKLHIFSND